MKQQSKLSQEKQQEQSAAVHQTQQAGQEFASAEEMLRFDAGQTVVPPQVAGRLKESTQSAAEQAPPPRSWWKNLFGR